MDRKYNISRRTLVRMLIGTAVAAAVPVRWAYRKIRYPVSRKDARHYKKLSVILIIRVLSTALTPAVCRAGAPVASVRIHKSF